MLLTGYCNFGVWYLLAYATRGNLCATTAIIVGVRPGEIVEVIYESAEIQ